MPDRKTMRGLLTLVVVMGVLIVAGVAVIGFTVAHRLTHIALPASAPSDVVLNQPTGTQIVGVASLGDRLAITLRGGGPDRVVSVGADGHVLETIRLAR